MPSLIEGQVACEQTHDLSSIVNAVDLILGDLRIPEPFVDSLPR